MLETITTLALANVLVAYYYLQTRPRMIAERAGAEVKTSPKTITLALSAVVMFSLIYRFIPSNAPTQGEDTNFALSFQGYTSEDVGRAKIRIKEPDVVNPQKPIDVGVAALTIEMWIQGEAADNTSSAQTCGANNNVINGNFLIDRARLGFGREYWLSIAGGEVLWGIGTTDDNSGRLTIGCGGTNVLDGEWHHIAVTRDASSGFMQVYVDGVLQDSGTGPTGDISFPSDGDISSTNCDERSHTGDCSFADPFIVIGCEKFDFLTAFCFEGLIDELRVSSLVRYTANFTPPTAAFTTDGATVGLYHFNEGTDTILTDDSGKSVDAAWDGTEPPNQEGALLISGGSGPLWVLSDAPTG